MVERYAVFSTLHWTLSVITCNFQSLFCVLFSCVCCSLFVWRSKSSFLRHNTSFRCQKRCSADERVGPVFPTEPRFWANFGRGTDDLASDLGLERIFRSWGLWGEMREFCEWIKIDICLLGCRVNGRDEVVNPETIFREPRNRGSPNPPPFRGADVQTNQTLATICFRGFMGLCSMIMSL